MAALIGAIRQLLETVADRRRFEVRYQKGAVILDCAKLGTEAGRALSYRDASLRDAVLRMALDDIYEDPERALRIRRCTDSQCCQIFFAERPDQTFCNHACANRAAARRYRERHARQRAQQAHEQYKKKRRKMQPGAVIKRIPRKVPLSRGLRMRKGALQRPENCFKLGLVACSPQREIAYRRPKLRPS